MICPTSTGWKSAAQNQSISSPPPSHPGACYKPAAGNGREIRNRNEGPLNYRPLGLNKSRGRSLGDRPRPRLPKLTGGQKRNVRFVGPGMLSPAGRQTVNIIISPKVLVISLLAIPHPHRMPAFDGHFRIQNPLLFLLKKK